MLRLLFFEYYRKQLVSEIDCVVYGCQNYEEYYFLNFRKVCECMRLIFGIGVVEVDFVDYFYVFVIFLGSIYVGMLYCVQVIFKIGLLIIFIICIENNCISEKKFWQVRNNLGIYVGRYYFMFGMFRKFILESFMQKQYL